MVSRKELRRIIALSGGEVFEYDREQTWADLFREQARLHPDRTAVSAENGELTYAELDRLSDRLAAQLAERENVRPDEFVAVRMGRVKEFHVAVLAVHKAGAAYMPLDLDYPQARVDYMMADSGARVTLTEARVTELLHSGGEEQAFVSRCGPERRAYMIYTSGSTGKPKGVVIPQKALTNLVHFIVRRWGLGEHSRIALHANFAFDAAVEDLFPALTAGGTVFVVPETARKDIFEMREYLATHRINGGCYATQFGQLLGADAELDLDYICLGGEAMTAVPRTRGHVYNTYGPTEFTVDATYYEIEKGREYRNIPIGRPLDGCAAYITDSSMNLLPPGETGELCLGGPQLAEGYWQRPELTAEKFTELEIPGKGKTRVYRTGDLARWNEEGQLEFCGRIDFQVKLRGFRIEPGEVENCAARYPGIRQAAAEVRRDTLCLYYTAAEEIDEAKLAAFMAESLTEYMVPGAFIRLEAMPYNVNGKIDRKALPDPAACADGDYAAPENEAEKAAAGAMARALGTEEKTLSVTRDFFEMGGDSIKAIRLVSMLREAGYTASVADVMQARTARKLAENLRRQGGAALSQEPIEGEVTDTAIFAFFRDLSYPEPDYFNQSTLLLWHGKADREALRKASDAITAQHDMLRAVLRDGHLFIRPAEDTIPVEKYTLEADTAENVRALCEGIQSHLKTGEALVRQALIHAGERDLFFLTAHHTIVDGVSWRIWLDDLETAYGQALRGEAVKLPRKTHTYRDYAEAMKAWRSAWGLAQEIPYWKKTEARMLATDTAANKDYTRRFETLSVDMSGEETDAFWQTKLNALRLEVNDLLLTAVGEGYRAVFGGDAVSVSLEGHGRENLGRDLSVDRTIGWFTSIYPVVLEGLTGEAEGDLIRVKETLHAVPNKGVGYNILAFVPGEPEVSLQTDRAPLMVFNYLGDVSGERAEGEYFEPDSADGFSAGLDYSAPRNHDGGDLAINCLIDGGKFTLWLDYNSERFTAEQARAFAEEILRRITALGAFLDSRKEALPPTASDLGETEWSPETFAAVVKAFAVRGERIRRIYPLTPMQEGMLLEHVAHPESLAYRLIDIYECEKPQEEAQLRRAIDALSAKHEVLRTAIIHKGVSPYRQAITDRVLPLRIVETAGEEDPFERAKRIRLEILHDGYDLQDRPLTQFVYVKGERKQYLLFVTHHIITDGWCFDTILRDLNTLLRGGDIGGGNDGLYERAVREMLARDRRAALKYYKDLLAGYENNAVIPSWGEVPEGERSADDQVRFALPAEEARKLAALCSDEGATPADGLNLAWGMALRTLNRADDVVFSTIASGRDGYSMDVTNLVGLFINPIPVRFTADRTMTPRQLLRKLHEQVTETMPYDYCPLAEIRQAAGDARLSGFIISFENYSEEAADQPLLKPVMSREEHGSDGIGIDAKAEADGRISVLISFDPAQYRRAEIERVFRLFRNNAVRAAEMPDTPLRELPLQSGEDQAAVLELSRGETLAYDASRTWMDLFREAAERHPDKTAVEAENGTLTYRELDRLSDRLAARLRAEGLEPDAFAAIRMGRVKEFLLAVAAVHKAGAAYVPIDPDYPEERVAYMLADSGAKPLLTEEKVAALLAEETAEEPAAGPLCGPDSRAYMIYTSGSTGKPKGVVVPHRCMMNLIHFSARRFGVDEESRIALHTNFAFDAAVGDLFPVLAFGGTLFIVPESARRDIGAMRKFIADHRISGFLCSMQFGQLLTMDELDVDFIGMGGEAMTAVPKVRGKAFNLYGPTECTVTTTWYELEKNRKYRNIPIGRPVDNCSALVVDEGMNLLPRGMIGELCLSGPQRAEGYWQQPEKTAEVFTDLRLPGGETIPVYRTGDLVRWNEEGQLEFYGRIDFQVKLRGFRIELGEIENVAKSCPGVAAAAAEVKKTGDTQILCLYYTEKSGETADEDELRQICRQKLTDYMVPAVFMRLDSMPLTPNGKVNRKLLPMPVFREAGEAAAPETETEKALYAAAAEILGVEGFGVTTPLTNLGMTSISAIRLSAEISCRLGRALNVSDILHTPTVRELAALADRPEGAEEPYAPQHDYPLSQTQMGIFVESELHPGTTIYNIPCLYKLDGATDLPRLREALERVILAHPYLSMTIGREAGEEPRAVRNTPAHIDIPVGTELPPAEALVRPFDLASGEALFRAELFDTKEGKYLFLDMHHIVSDGSSMAVLLADLDAAYAGKTIEAEAYTGYEFALDEQKARDSERYAKAKAWYDSVCRGCEPCTLPVKEEGASGGDIAAGQTAGKTDAEAVRQYCEANGLTPNAFFTTAFALALKAYTGSEEAVFCTIYNGRSDPRTERSVAMFVKTLPVVAACAPEKTVKETVGECQRYLLSAMSNDIFSFAEVRENYGITSDVLFAYQGEAIPETRIGGLPAREIDLALSRTKETFGLDVSLSGGQVIYTTEYDPAMYGPRTMDGFIRMMDVICGEMLTKETVGEIRLVTAEDEEAIRALYDTDFPVAQRPAYRLLQDSAARLPGKTAVIAADRTMTYAELNGEANALGRALIGKGAGVESIVAVMAERNSYAYVMRQGVLKSGAAFLPVDPEYPEERIDFILGNAGVRLLVTTRSVILRRQALMKKLAGKGITVIDAQKAVSAHKGETKDLNIDVQPDAPAYVIYTSGSTGTPKGVMLTNRNLVNFTDSNEKNRESREYAQRGNVSLAIAALTFDVSVMEEFLPLANGMTVVMATEEEIMNPAELAALMLPSRVNAMTCTPSYLLNLLMTDVFIPAVKALKVLDVGAEEFPPSLFTKLRALNPDLFIMNGYGPTEATISCTMEVVESAEDVTIGLPNGNVHVATLDRDGRLQPPGALGEMVIMGEGVGRGYVGQDDLTKKSFITLLGRRAYRSGDLVRLLADGRIEFHGRMDNQVKLRGLRVELGEIESVLNRYPGVRSSIVVVDVKEMCLIAYFTADGKVDTGALKAHLGTYLTAYMVPQVIMQLDEMPLTANGKIDKKALPAPQYEKKERTVVKPSTPLQEQLCGMFRKALGTDEIGVNESFFELGGTSLKASVVLMSAMTADLPITYQDIFNAPTVEKLAQIVLERQATGKQERNTVREQKRDCLACNTNAYLDELEQTPLGGVLLTGATGFLGIHILRDLIEHTDETIHCLVRRTKIDTTQRLKGMLYYYFDTDYKELFGKRVFVAEGDLTDPESLKAAMKADFSTVINAAASVKHFAEIGRLMNNNYRGVENLAALCLEKGVRLIQISTVSVAGDAIGGLREGQCLREDRLEIGQDVESNGYVHSKYLAEKHILECIEQKHLDARIIRVSNLSSRIRDGEFQMNFRTNAFMNTLRAYAALHCYPASGMSGKIEFSYIDETARAVVLLSGTGGPFTVFHAYNSHTVEMGDIIYAMNDLGIRIDVVKDAEFRKRLREGLADDGINHFLSPLVDYDLSDDDNRTEIPVENGFTINALYRLGFRWEITDIAGIERMLHALDTLGFFTV